MLERDGTFQEQYLDCCSYIWSRTCVARINVEYLFLFSNMYKLPCTFMYIMNESNFQSRYNIENGSDVLVYCD